MRAKRDNPVAEVRPTFGFMVQICFITRSSCLALTHYGDLQVVNMYARYLDSINSVLMFDHLCCPYWNTELSNVVPFTITPLRHQSSENENEYFQYSDPLHGVIGQLCYGDGCASLFSNSLRNHFSHFSHEVQHHEWIPGEKNVLFLYLYAIVFLLMFL